MIFLYSTVSSLKSIFGMVVITSPSSSSHCPCWTSSSVHGCFGTGWLQLSSVVRFSSLSRSQSFGSRCLLLAMFFSCLPLALLFCLLLALLFSVLSLNAPDLRCSSRVVLVPVLLCFILLFFSQLALWRWFRLCSSFFWRRLHQHIFGVLYCFEVCLMHLQRNYSACATS